MKRRQFLVNEIPISNCNSLRLNYHFALFDLGVSDGREPACNVGELDSIPESGISPGEGNGNPLQYSCLENPMDRHDWQATAHGVSKSQL